MKCPSCGFDAEGSIDKCLRCEEPFEPNPPDYEELECKLEELASELCTADVENHSEVMGEIERIVGELGMILEIYNTYEGVKL